VNTENFKEVHALGNTGSRIQEEFQEVFDGQLGVIPGETHLETDPSITPEVAASRRVPIAMKPRLKEELERMTREGVIEKVEQPTDWVSSMAMAVKKTGELRICIDPKPLNKALKREHYQLPTLEDVLPDMAGARVMSTVDLKAGYWHILLDHESSLINTFNTPFGRYKWNRLPFGLKVSSEIFQRKLQQQVGDIEGVICIADDMIICGCGQTDEEATKDHDAKFRKLLTRCRQVGIKLNPNKMKLRQSSVPFMGHLVSKDGLKPDPEKIQAVQNMPHPTDVEGVQRLNGFVNY
jgi:hypothetical protein